MRIASNFWRSGSGQSPPLLGCKDLVADLVPIHVRRRTPVSAPCSFLRYGGLSRDSLCGLARQRCFFHPQTKFQLICDGSCFTDLQRTSTFVRACGLQLEPAWLSSVDVCRSQSTVVHICDQRHRHHQAISGLSCWRTAVDSARYYMMMLMTR